MTTKPLLTLPIPSDLSVCAFQWAARLLGETPLKLWVTPEEHDAAGRVFGDLTISIDETLAPMAWMLEGPTKRVFSEGA